MQLTWLGYETVEITVYSEVVKSVSPIRNLMLRNTDDEDGELGSRKRQSDTERRREDGTHPGRQEV